MGSRQFYGTTPDRRRTAAPPMAIRALRLPAGLVVAVGGGSGWPRAAEACLRPGIDEEVPIRGSCGHPARVFPPPIGVLHRNENGVRTMTEWPP
jgi:hypothetical protein